MLEFECAKIVGAWIPVQVASGEKAGMPEQKKRWRCSHACILKSKLDRYHEIKLKIKFRL